MELQRKAIYGSKGRCVTNYTTGQQQIANNIRPYGATATHTGLAVQQRGPGATHTPKPSRG